MPSKLKAFFFQLIKKIYNMATLSGPAPKDPETDLLALVQLDTENYIERFVPHLKAILKRSPPDILRVRSASIVKQFSKNSEHEYFTAHLEHPDGTLVYVSLERAGVNDRHPAPPRDTPRDSQSTSKLKRMKAFLLPKPNDGGNPTPRTPVLQVPLDPDSQPHHPLDTIINSEESQGPHLNPPERLRTRLSFSSLFTSARSSSSPSLVSLESCFPNGEANDVIRLHSKPTQQDKDVIIGTLNLDDVHDPVYLQDLVVLAMTVHRHKSRYGLLSSNCFWFTALIIEVLEQCVARKMTMSPNSPRWGWIVTENMKWSFVDITSSCPSAETVAAVSKEFNLYMEKFNAEVNIERKANQVLRQKAEAADKAQEEIDKLRDVAQKLKAELQKLKDGLEVQAAHQNPEYIQ
ncbi:hypothetical protein GALMADRAFT_145549 [Galerina marginata CBS 339.88]|uniref:Uncharacterized protein n=1 Tax=Galerina marginata (strain CBS 339.88) TaxID=685588 RepID=A0A067SPB8_GALM3|nr:hypothetical protein GALMADRAFT_145549 [Galerina marginata CBS 339.88]